MDGGFVLQNAPAVGDLESSAKGSGARFNSGKTAFDLLPLATVVSLAGYDVRHWATCVLGRLAEWQGGDELSLDAACWIAANSAGKGLHGYSEAARVFDYGRRKYKDWNWAKGMRWSIPLGCAVRHLVAILDGELLDPESGLPHRGHVLCNLLMLLTYRYSFTDGDDRPVEYLKATINQSKDKN